MKRVRMKRSQNKIELFLKSEKSFILQFVATICYNKFIVEKFPDNSVLFQFKS